jgi:hypothetical protein
VTTRETVAFVCFAGSLVALIAALVYVVRARDPKHTALEVLAGGPLLFVSPEKYFPSARRSAPWYAVLIWLLPTVILWFVSGVF